MRHACSAGYLANPIKQFIHFAFSEVVVSSETLVCPWEVWDGDKEGKGRFGILDACRHGTRMLGGWDGEEIFLGLGGIGVDCRVGSVMVW
jgi:hypothetical protein